MVKLGGRVCLNYDMSFKEIIPLSLHCLLSAHEDIETISGCSVKGGR